MNLDNFGAKGSSITKLCHLTCSKVEMIMSVQF